MAARTGMANLITKIRSMTASGTADYTINGAAYWTDDQLEDRLDQQRSSFRKMRLDPDRELIDGVYSYTAYPFPEQMRDYAIEESATGSGWRLFDSAGNTISTNDYTVNYEAGVITFNSSTTGINYYLDCRGYDLEAAAAQIWSEKAAHAALRVDWKSDNHQVAASQYRAQAEKMADYYRKQSRTNAAQLTMLWRVDER